MKAESHGWSYGVSGFRTLFQHLPPLGFPLPRRTKEVSGCFIRPGSWADSVHFACSCVLVASVYKCIYVWLCARLCPCASICVRVAFYPGKLVLLQYLWLYATDVLHRSL